MDFIQSALRSFLNPSGVDPIAKVESFLKDYYIKQDKNSFIIRAIQTLNINELDYILPLIEKNKNGFFNGIKFDATDKYGNCALHLLFQKFSNQPNHTLIETVEIYSKIMQYLVMKEPRLIGIRNLIDDTPLHILVKRSDHKSSQFKNKLLPEFFNYVSLRDKTLFEAENIEGNTPLHTASAYGQTEAIKNLLSRGVKYNCRNQEGNTPLHYAVSFRNPYVYEVEGIWVDRKKFFSNFRNAIEILVKANADIFVENNKNYSPIQLTYAFHIHAASLEKECKINVPVEVPPNSNLEYRLYPRQAVFRELEKLATVKNEIKYKNSILSVQNFISNSEFSAPQNSICFTYLPNEAPPFIFNTGYFNKIPQLESSAILSSRP